MLKNIVTLLLFTVPNVFLYQQDEYDIQMERVVAKNVDKNFVQTYTVDNVKYNRTARAVNVTFKPAHDLLQLNVKVQAYKFTSNEYRIFPIQFTFNLCEAFQTNSFGLNNLLICGNLTRCNYKKGNTYTICNWSPLSNKFPPHVPAGRYLLNLQLICSSTVIAIVEGYFTLVYKH